MATKSAGIPSDTASSASPRYLRTFGASSTSLSSRQSRIASAISVGVISSSPASSATELTSAIAFRIRSAAARPGTVPPLFFRRLAGADNDAALRLLADARARDVRVAFQRQVDGSALERLHRVERDRVAGHLDLAGGAHAHVLEKAFNQGPGHLGLAVGSSGRSPNRGCTLVDDCDLDKGLLRCLAEDLDVDVAPAFLKLDQRRVDRLVKRAAAAFGGSHVRSLSLPCL